MLNKTQLEISVALIHLSISHTPGVQPMIKCVRCEDLSSTQPQDKTNMICLIVSHNNKNAER